MSCEEDSCYESLKCKEELFDLDSDKQLSEGGGGGSSHSNNGTFSDEMSVCVEPNTVLTSQVSTNHASTTTEVPSSSPGGGCDGNNSHVEKVSVAKIIMANSTAISSAKVVNQPLITVMNTPITVVKTLSSATPSHFTLVNSAAVKSPTITLVNAPPITVVKNLNSEAVVKSMDCSNNSTTVNANNGSINNGSMSTLVDKTTVQQNVYLKKSASNVDSGQDIPQSHKILTANTFPTNNVVQSLTNSINKPVNGQKPVSQSKVKILSNVVMTAPGPSNLLLNKTNNQRFYSQSAKVSNNGTPQKFISKAPPNNAVKTSSASGKNYPEKMTQRLLYSGQKTTPTTAQFKTFPSANYPGKTVGIKTLNSQIKSIPGQVQRTSAGLRTIPPQRPPKPANKPNYIGKHAVQAQKLRPLHVPPKIKSVKHSSPINSYHSRLPQNSQVTFNQALTAQILETLGQDNAAKNTSYEQSARYDSFNYMENKIVPEPQPIPRQQEYKPQSNLDTLSFVCQAVLLDHNYNATLPSELPPTPTISTSPQINGGPGVSMYSPGSSKRVRTTSSCSTSMLPIAPTTTPIPPNNNNNNTNNNIPAQDDDAASDISCSSDRKIDTEGEETDTAPEAEAVVNNDDPSDRYGDYVTRCICGFIHDDGYMIECDKCKVWQHVRCVIKSKKVPDDYLCEVCDPSKQLDRQKARALQQQWMREIQEREAKIRKEQMKEILTDTDSSDGEMIPNNNNLSAKTRRKSDCNSRQINRQKRESSKDVLPKRTLKRKERKMVKRKMKSSKSHSDDEKRDNQSQLPQLRQWIENYEEAVTNHYSPELRARISNIRINGAHSELMGQVDPSVHKCRVQNLGGGIKCLVATSSLSPSTPVLELRGKYMLSTQHRTTHGGSLTTRQQRPGPFLFFYRLHKDNTEVCVDTRTYGNSARFVRRSCQPNAELRHCIEKGVLHLYLVTLTSVEKNYELTIKHESHDLAVVGSTEIPCACGNIERCLVNKIKKNGETVSTDMGHRKRRTRRVMSTSLDSSLSPVKVKDEQQPAEIKQEVEEDDEEEKEIKKEELPSNQQQQQDEDIKNVKKEKEEVKEELDLMMTDDKVKVKKEEEEIEKVEVKEEIKDEDTQSDELVKVTEEEKEEPPVIQSPPPPPPPPVQVNTRRASAVKKDHQVQAQAQAQDSDEKQQEKSEKESPHSQTHEEVVSDKSKKDNKKLSREERKLQAIMKAIERMERQEQRKQEHQAKQAHRRESEPSPSTREEEKCLRSKRRKRKGRSRTISTNSQSGCGGGSGNRRNRLDSADSQQASSDEILLSPTDNSINESPSKTAGLLLSLASSDNSVQQHPVKEEIKSPERVRGGDMDSNSNSANSSPETPLSSACLLVAAAVEPLEPGFKFPKTKKGLMNEWLNKGPEVVQPASQISPSSLQPHIDSSFDVNAAGLYTPSKNLTALAQAATFCSAESHSQPKSSAKKRWLRQAISEDQCDSPTSRPDSPPMSEPVAPPKKRRLPRESVSSEGGALATTPPTTPTRTTSPMSFKEGKEDLKLETDEFPKGAEFRTPISCFSVDHCEPISSSISNINKENVRKDLSLGIPTDPRLGRFTNSEQLVGTVEKTLSFLGFEEKKPETITPTKRKLSITEYLQRKKIHSDKTEEVICAEDNTSSTSQSPKPARNNRSNSSSSNTSPATSDDEGPTVVDLPEKAISAFNSEPTELERQRETVSLRAKKALGIPIDDKALHPALAVSSLLKGDAKSSSSAIQASIPLHDTSPFPSIPGSATSNDSTTTATAISPDMPTQSAHTVSISPAKKSEDKEVSSSSLSSSVMFYTPDDEETAAASTASVESQEDSCLEKTTEPTDYVVPPFNNPLYPNSSYTTYGSVIDDDVPYEGRNPSPPPNMEGGLP